MNTIFMMEPTQEPFLLTLGRAVDEGAADHDSLVHIWWKLRDPQGHFVQVYVNEELFEVSTDPSQRELWLVLDRTKPQRIELLAIPVEQAQDVWESRPELLRSWSPPIRDRLGAKILRDESLPIDARINVQLNGEPIADGPLWDGDTSRSGFGSLFGIGGFGQDAATGLGLGRGELGFGPLGTDATAWCYQANHLPAGEHQLSFEALDQDGRPVAPPINTSTTTTDALPTPAQSLAVQPDFTLVWTS